MRDKINKYRSYLTRENYKFTSQREIILKVLLAKKGEHLSAEDVYNIVKDNNPNIGLATVYRTLELFSELEIIQQLDFDDNCKRYEIGSEKDHHHHLICNSCNSVTEFNDQILEEFETNLAKEYNFEATDHSIKFFGYCAECN